jgi:hypothetical protein
MSAPDVDMEGAHGPEKPSQRNKQKQYGMLLDATQDES